MTVSEIKKMKWNKADWKKAEIFSGGDGYISNEGIQLFLDGLYNSLSRDLNISEQQIKKLVQDNNKEFFSLMDKIFWSKITTIKEGSPVYKELEESLRIPDAEFDIIVSRIEKMLKQYKELSQFERIEFNSMVDDFEMSLKREKKD